MIISKNTRSIVYSFLPTIEIVKKISKLSKKDRKVLVTQDREIIKSRDMLYIKAETIYGLISDPDFDFKLKNYLKAFRYQLSITNGLCIDDGKYVDCTQQLILKVLLKSEKLVQNIGRKLVHATARFAHTNCYSFFPYLPDH